MARFGSLGQQLTHSELLKLIHYNPQTGIVVRIKKPTKGWRGKVGAPMGSPHSSGYLEARINGRSYLLHRLAWFYVHGKWPDNIDHINHDRTDNRLCNLRNVTRTENQRNQSKKTNNSSGVTGVYWRKDRQKWVAKIKVNYREVNLLSTDDFFEAVCARRSAERSYGFHENHGRSVA